MHIKFLAHGTGDPKRAADYLMAPIDHAGIERAGVRVLRGSSTHVADLAASLRTTHRYTSGVIAWAHDDEPTADEIEAVLADFERTAFAGLQPNQYCWSAIQHIEQDGSTHVHVFAARVELLSGKALNIAPPGWQKTFDPLRDAWNYEKGWARPDDVARARLVQPGSARAAQLRNLSIQAPASADALADALAVEPDTKGLIASWISARVRAGEIQTRDDVLSALSELGEFNRVSDQYVSVRLAGHAKPVRLAGLLFAKNFQPSYVLAAETTAVRAKRAARNTTAADAARRDLNASIARRAEYNTQRYPAAPIQISRAIQELVAGTRRQLQHRARRSMPQHRRGLFGVHRPAARRPAGERTGVVACVALITAERSAARRLLAAAGRAGISAGIWHEPAERDSRFDRFPDDWGLLETRAVRDAAAKSARRVGGQAAVAAVHALPSGGVANGLEITVGVLSADAQGNLGRGSAGEHRGVLRVRGSARADQQQSLTLKRWEKFMALVKQQDAAAADAVNSPLAALKASVQSGIVARARNQQTIEIVNIDIGDVMRKRDASCLPDAIPKSTLTQSPLASAAASHSLIRSSRDTDVPDIDDELVDNNTSAKSQTAQSIERQSSHYEAEDRADRLMCLPVALPEIVARTFGLSLNLPQRDGQITGTVSAGTDPVAIKEFQEVTDGVENDAYDRLARGEKQNQGNTVEDGGDGDSDDIRRTSERGG